MRPEPRNSSPKLPKMTPQPERDEHIAPPALQDGLVDRYIARRVCARCFGDLQKKLAPERMWAVYCPRCQAAWNFATVSRRYAEWLGQEAIAQLCQARENFQDLFPNPHKGKTAPQLLRELGY